LFVCFVPLPISRVRGAALVQPHPDATSQVGLRRNAILTEVKAGPGDRVKEGMVLATFRDDDLEQKLSAAQAEWQSAEGQRRLLEDQKENIPDAREKARVVEQIAQVMGRSRAAKATMESLQKIKDTELVLVAPRDGIVGTAPRVDDVGKLFEGGGGQQQQQQQDKALFTIHDPGRVRLCMPLATSDYHRLRQDLEALQKQNRKRGQDRKLSVTLRVRGLDRSTWEGEIARLDESEAKYIPPMLSSRAGGPVEVQPPSGKSQGLVPQTQQYLIYIDIIDPDESITVGQMGHAKVYLRHETCLHWLWRTVNDVFNLQLL
jgi:multidrug efflux pump subunit AcrA (membrane-fusion protein)